MDELSHFIFNVFVNSFLTFFTVAALIEGIIFLFRINQGRYASILRMFPILKLPFDVFYYDFSNWAYLHAINPLTCENGSRTLSISFGYFDAIFPSSSYIKFTAPENTTFTIADIFGELISSSLLNTLCMVLLLLSLFFAIRKILVYHFFAKALKPLIKEKPCINRKITNKHIKKIFQKKQPQMIASSFAVSTFTAGLFSPAIYIPTNFYENLSQKEYEAILAHEIEHIRHRDNLVRFLLDFIGSIFFWIPTTWLRKRIEEGQEIDCDYRCTNYKISHLDLASAICKSAKNSMKTSKHHVFAHFLEKSTIQKRLEILLKTTSHNYKKLRLTFCCLMAIQAFFMIFLGRFWIF